MRPNDPADLRELRRIEAAFRVKYRSLDDFVVAYTADISRGGMFVATSAVRPIGSVVKLKLEVPDRGAIAIIARVAHVRSPEIAERIGKPAGMGMELLDVEGPPLEDQLAELFAGDVAPEPLRAPPVHALVVDDVASWRERVSALMRAEGHRVSEAADGVQALGSVLRNPPDLILTDVQMPGMDGWQLLRMIRARPNVSHIPVIFLTTLSGENERLKGYQLGVDDYIAKPFDDDELVARVRRIANRSRMRPGRIANRNVMRGDLSQVALASVLSFIEMERRTGLLLVIAASGEIATVHIRDGRPLRVDLADDDAGLSGVDALYHVLDWTAGWFELGAGEVAIDDEVGATVQHVLLEHARRRDEA